MRAPTLKGTAFPRQRGFVLVEVLAIIFVTGLSLVALVLIPTLQKVREADNRERAKLVALQIVSCAKDFLASTGHFPPSLNELRGSCRILDQLPAGEKDGYRFFIISAGGWSLVAEPVFPGLTASHTHVFNIAGAMESSPTPGAGQMRQQALDRIYKKAAEVVASLLNLNSESLSRIRAFAEDHSPGSSSFFEAFTGFDANGDGKVSFSEISAFGPPPDDDLKALFLNFRTFALGELKLGAGNEDVNALSAVRLEDVAEAGGNPAELFSYQGQCRLARLILPAVQAPGDDPGASLCEQLAAAQQMELRGDLRVKQQKLAAYRRLISAHAGKNISHADANTLITLSKAL